MPVSYSLEIAKNSLGTYQRALDVTSHNVANANNANFSRQKILFGTEKSTTQNLQEIGAGVKIDDILRVRNSLTDLQIRNYNQKYADVNKRSMLLEHVEGLFTEPSELGLSTTLTTFFNSWDELAVTPNSIPLRRNVINTAKTLSGQISNIYDGLHQIKNDVQSEALVKTEKLNALLKEVQNLNNQIGTANINNQPANDLMDKRDELIDELSTLANINVVIDKNSSANISIGGVFAVDQYNYSQFKVSVKDDQMILTKEDGSGRVNLSGGELNALADTFSNKIPDYINKINTIGQAVMDSVNELHSTGNTMTSPPETNIDFFGSFTGGVLSINALILEDTNYLAVSSNGEAGNGDIALKIANLKNKKIVDNESINGFYISLVSNIGTEKQVNDDYVESNQLVLEQLEQQKSSYSGVSVDEEMTNIIKFQRSYEASAKLIRVADEMLQTLLTMV